MKVKELIEHLEEFNPEDFVYVLYEYGSKPVEFVSQVETVYGADGVPVCYEKILIQ